MATIQKDGAEAGAPGRRRQRRSRGRRADGGIGQSSSSVPVTSPVEVVAGHAPPSSSSNDDQDPVVRPRKIIDRSAALIQREDELSRALVVSVFGNALDDSPESIKATIAQRFSLEDEELIIHCFGASSFLMTFANADSATRVYNEGRPIITHTHRLHVRRWSRLLHSAAAVLSVPVEIELRGIPAHAWDLATAEHLLNEYCWIEGLNPDTENCRDVFRVTAWCSSPSGVPEGLELGIVEPLVAGVHPHEGRRCLDYQIEISCSPVDLHPPADAPPPLPRADQQGGRHRRRWRRRRGSLAESPSSSAPGSSAKARFPVHDRLGSIGASCNLLSPNATIDVAPAVNCGPPPEEFIRDGASPGSKLPACPEEPACVAPAEVVTAARGSPEAPRFNALAPDDEVCTWPEESSREAHV